MATVTAPAGGGIQTGSRRFPQLDGLRAVAALSVVATHAGFHTGRSTDAGPFAPFLARMDFGVTIFFLLSGFLLYRPFVAAALAGRDGPAVRGFYWRRALRIFPAYWLATLVTLATVGPYRPSLGDWLRYLTLTHTYVDQRQNVALTQMWTLVVEVSFYAVLPLLAALTLRPGQPAHVLVRRQALLLAGLALGTAGWAWVVRSRAVAGGGRPLLWLPAYLDWFAIGMAFAVASCALRHPGWPRHGRLRLLDRAADDTGTCWVIAGLLFWTATLPLAGPRDLSGLTTWEWFTKHYLYAAAAAFLLLPAVFGDPDRGVLRAFLASRPMRFLGEISYGVYLWHLTLLTVLADVLGFNLFQGGFAKLYPLTVAAAVTVATASYLALERPLLALGRSSRVSAEPSTVAASPPSTAAQQN